MRFAFCIVSLGITLLPTFAIAASCENSYLKMPCDNNGPYTCRQRYKDLAACKDVEKRDREARKSESAKPAQDANANAVQLINKANVQLQGKSVDHAPSRVVSPRLNDHTRAPVEGGLSF
jgi:hypothetical protein